LVQGKLVQIRSLQAARNTMIYVTKLSVGWLTTSTCLLQTWIPQASLWRPTWKL